MIQSDPAVKNPAKHNEPGQSKQKGKLNAIPQIIA
jgi:hypothetical protein